ncbi:MAG: hypothetical protein HKN86_02610 [Acidimicrobiia bacterium]|jgi:hypothetical protein|nr:hypothetical protein [Acidimicrobiia bacterium]
MSTGRWALNNFSSNTSSQITVEGSFLDSEIKALQAKGHEVNQIQEDYDKAYGPVSAIYKDVENEWTGAADVRVGTEKVETL